MGYELLLYFTAALLKNRRYRRLNTFLASEFHIPDPTSTHGRLRTYRAFQQYPQSLVERKQVLKTQRFSLLADLMRDRATRSDLTLDELIEADFVLFVYSAVNSHDRLGTWYPYVTIFADDCGALPLFDRARSVRAFKSTLAEIFGIASKDELVDAVRRAADDRYREFWEQIDPVSLMNEPLLESRE